jgi:uroporphyrinogen III methyltransferase/synthase
VLLATGHEDPTRPTSRLRWETLTHCADTLVFMMSVRNLGAILKKLREHGQEASTPAALIEWGTWPCQRTLVGTLDTLAEEARRAEVGPPALLVVGDVVSVRERTAWIERRPLLGRRVLVTRARHQVAHFRELLSEAGAEVVEFPTLEIRPPSSWGAADRAIAALESYAWVLFTSANGVDAFLNRLWERGRDLRALGQARIGAIGPATARRLQERGLRVDMSPREYRAEGILEALHGRVRGARILLARAREARDILPRQLKEAEGAHIDVVEVYRSEVPKADAAGLRRSLEEKKIDVATFTSSSSVKNLASLLGVRDLSGLFGACEVACIGPITSETARAHGLSPSIEPEKYTIPALAAAVIDRFRNCPSGTRPPK